MLEKSYNNCIALEWIYMNAVEFCKKKKDIPLVILCNQRVILQQVKTKSSVIINNDFNCYVTERNVWMLNI